MDIFITTGNFVILMMRPGLTFYSSLEHNLLQVWMESDKADFELKLTKKISFEVV